MIKVALAHEGETHEAAVEATVHYFDFLLSPFVAILTFFIVVSLTALILRKLKVKPSIGALIILILLLTSSVVGFIFVPPLGVVAIILGFVFAIIVSFSGIQKGG